MYFMWSWQVYFRISCQTTSESLFNQLDRGLNPRVFLLGFLLEGIEADTPPICIDPEDIGYPLENFNSIKELAQRIHSESEDKNLFYTGEGMQEEMDRRLQVKSHKDAIEKILNESAQNEGRICFVTMPVSVGNYSVYVILELDRKVYQSHMILQKTKWDRFTIFRSLIEASVNVYLEEMKKNLLMPDPGKNLSSDSRTTEELLKAASRSLMYTVSVNGHNGHGLHGLYPVCNQISISRYEKSENTGYLIVAKKDHPDVEMTLKLEVPFSIHDYRKTRKLLQLANEEIGVVCNSYEILGLGKIKKTYDPLSESVFEIRFKGVHCWDIEHGKKNLFQMRYGNPQIYSESIDKNKVFSDAKRIFPGITNSQFDNLFSLFNAATKQEKGAMLIVSSTAKAESTRLEKQCLCIQPVSLTQDLILNLTSIDGGVLLDIDGTAYAHGVILDGIVGNNGNAARGSRYNSAVTYQEYNRLKNPTMIVVVSEDGTVDIIPSLKPQIKHSEIIDVIGILEELNSDEKYDRGTFNKAIEWLQNREFYLTAEECKKINKLKSEIDERDKDTSIRFVYEDFKPNPEMNDSYYL